MDTEKQAAFVRKMRKKRLGLTKRQHFDGGGISGLIGAAGGTGGTGFNVNPGTNQEQINNAYNRNQAALTGQENLANTLAPQAGTAVGAQNVLGQQYAQQAAGQGPNVAKTMLNQTTGQNVANQAALMAGQRGASANPALLAREAAQQGATTQQQAAGQAATMQAQQQIAAEQAQAQLAANQIAQSQGATTAATQANQGEQGILQGANTANAGIQGQLAGQTMAGQQKILGGIGNALGAVTGLFEEGGEVHGPKKLDFIHKMTKLGMDHFHGPKMSDGGSVPGPVLPGADSFVKGFRQAHADGGEVQKMADGGGLNVPQVNYQAPNNPFIPIQPSQSNFTLGNYDTSPMWGKDPKKDNKDKKSNTMDQMNADIPAQAQSVLGASPQILSDIPLAVGAAKGGEMHNPFEGPHDNPFVNYFSMSKGGKVPALVSPGEIYLNPEQVQKVIQDDVDPAKIGKKYGGKAKVKGDSKKNDFIPDDLDDGGVVIDREHVMSPEKRKLFVHKSIAKKKMGSR